MRRLSSIFTFPLRRRLLLGKKFAEQRTSPASASASASKRSRFWASPRSSQQVLLRRRARKNITKHLLLAKRPRFSPEESLETEEMCSKRRRKDDSANITKNLPLAPPKTSQQSIPHGKDAKNIINPPDRHLPAKCPSPDKSLETEKVCSKKQKCATELDKLHRESMTYDDYVKEEDDKRQRVHMKRVLKRKKDPWVPMVLLEKYREVVNASEGYDVPIIPGGYRCGTIDAFDIKKNSVEELKIYSGVEAALVQYNCKKGTDYKFLDVVKSTHALVRGHMFYVTFVAVARNERRFTTFEAEVWADLESEVKVTLCRQKSSTKN